MEQIMIFLGAVAAALGVWFYRVRKNIVSSRSSQSMNVSYRSQKFRGFTFYFSPCDGVLSCTKPLARCIEFKALNFYSACRRVQKLGHRVSVVDFNDVPDAVKNLRQIIRDFDLKVVSVKDG